MEPFFYSRIIPIQENTQVYKIGSQLFIKGPLGLSFLSFPETLFFKKNDQGYQFFGSIKNKQLILTFTKIFLNKLKGVYLGFFEILIINGTGWRVSFKNEATLHFSLGYSYLVEYPLKKNIEILIYDKQRFKVFGLDLDAVQQVVSDLCKLRDFNVYKGKGIYKQDQVLKLKESSKSKA